MEEQAISLVGYDVYEKLVKGYTEKQWGRDCKDLPSFIIKRLPVRFTYNNNYFNDKYQGIPIGGYTQIIEKMLENTDYFEFIKEHQNIAKTIIYTGEIDRFYNYRFGKLDYRSLKFETEVLNVQNYQGNAVVNYTERDIPYTRIIEHKHFESSDTPKTVVTKEYPSTYDNNNEPYYPVNDIKNTELYAKYKELAETEQNVFFCGRLGQYKYFDMDKVTEDTLNLTEKIIV